jgi:hypothetical protein
MVQYPDTGWVAATGLIKTIIANIWFLPASGPAWMKMLMPQSKAEVAIVPI